MMMISAPTWKSKIVGAWMNLVQVEDVKTLIRWIVPYVLLYVKSECIESWPSQRQPERGLFVKTMADAILESGVDNIELAKFIEELTQNTLPTPPESRHDLHLNFGASAIRKDSHLTHNVQHRFNTRSKCLQCGHLMLTRSLKRHMKKFHSNFSVTDGSSKITSPKNDQQPVADLISSTLPHATSSCFPSPISSLIPGKGSEDTSLSEVVASCSSVGPYWETRGTTNFIDNTQAETSQVFNLWNFPSNLQHVADSTKKSISQNDCEENVLQASKGNECAGSEKYDSDSSSAVLEECSGPNSNSTSTSMVLRHRIDLPKLHFEDHRDLRRIENELLLFYQLQGRTSLQQPRLLMTTLCRLLSFSKSEIKLDELRYLDHALDVALKTPRILIPYISAYTSQTPVASSIRNEVNRIRDLLHWRCNLLLIGSADDLARRQMLSMENFLKTMQSNLQRMVVVRSAEELDSLGMWSSMKELRNAVVIAFKEIRDSVLDTATSINQALRFQQTLIACAYVSMRPQRRGVWRDMRVSDVSPTYTTSAFKTSKKFQYLCFTFPSELYRLIQEWINVHRPSIASRFLQHTADDGWLFVTLMGKKREISSDVSEFFFSRTGKILNPTRIRCIYRTEIQSSNLPTNDLEIIDSADCHGKEVVNTHYVKTDRVSISEKADQIYDNIFGTFVESGQQHGSTEKEDAIFNVLPNGPLCETSFE